MASKSEPNAGTSFDPSSGRVHRSLNSGRHGLDPLWRALVGNGGRSELLDKTQLTAHLSDTILHCVIISKKALRHFDTAPTFERCGGENCGNCEPSCEKCCESVSSRGATGPAVRSIDEAHLSLR